MTNTNEVEGIIEETLPRGLYAVRLEDGRRIRATLTTAARRVTVKLLDGDRVLLTVSEYDSSRGRITARID